MSRHEFNKYFYTIVSGKCDKIIREMRENPPGLRGWLKGGVDSDRMKMVKEELEGGDADMKS
jgi:hypothetical protein